MKRFRSVIIKMMIVLLAVGGLAVAKADTAATAASLTTKGSVWVNGSNVNVREKGSSGVMVGKNHPHPQCLC